MRINDTANNQISSIILAGGRGTRAGGQDKGLIRYRDKLLIEHVINKISPQVDEIIISANRNTDAYRKYSDKVISDSDDGYRGPLSGIVSCLPHCKHEQVLIVACDMPQLPDDIVKRLSLNKGSNAISIASVNDKHQLALLLDRQLIDSLQQHLLDDQRSLIRWVESLPYAATSFDDKAEMFTNLNTL